MLITGTIDQRLGTEFEWELGRGYIDVFPCSILVVVSPE